MSYVRSSWPAFGRVPKPLLYSGLSDRALRLVAILDDQAAIRAEFTRQHLAEWLGCSTASAERAISELEQSGWLVVVRSRDSRGQRPNQFELVWPDEVPLTPELSPEGAPDAHSDQVSDTSPMQGGVITGDEGVESSVPGGVITSDEHPLLMGDEHLNRKRDNIRRDKNAPSSKPRPRNEIFDSLVEAFAIDPTQLTKSKCSALGKNTAELRDVGATPQEIHARVARMRRTWKPHMCTPFALVAHWDEFAGDTAQRSDVPHYWRRRA